MDEWIPDYLTRLYELYSPFTVGRCEWMIALAELERTGLEAYTALLS
jgi:hypothetical protein